MRLRTPPYLDSSMMSFTWIRPFPSLFVICKWSKLDGWKEEWGWFNPTSVAVLALSKTRFLLASNPCSPFRVLSRETKSEMESMGSKLSSYPPFAIEYKYNCMFVPHMCKGWNSDCIHVLVIHSGIHVKPYQNTLDKLPLNHGNRWEVVWTIALHTELVLPCGKPASNFCPAQTRSNESTFNLRSSCAC